MNLAITGHRPPKLGGYHLPNPIHTAVHGLLVESLEQLDPDLVYLGMSLGVDQWAAQICANLGIRFIACIPFIGYESRWPEVSKQEFRRLLSVAYDVIFVTRTSQYEGRLMQVRNEFMVDRCDRLLAVWNGNQEGGTWNCLRYAMRVEKPIIRLNLSQELLAQAAEIERVLNAQRAEREQQQANRARQTLTVQFGAGEQVPPPAPPLSSRQPPNLPRPTQVPRLGGQAFMAALEEMLRNNLEPAAVGVTHPEDVSDLEALAEEARIEIIGSQVARTGVEQLQDVPAEKETIEPAKRFIPGRLLDLDD